MTKDQELVIDNVFRSLQLMSYYELYYHFDFSVQRVKNFNEIMTRKNEELTPDKVREYEKVLKNNIGFDCETEAKKFPMRPKYAMAKIKPKDLIKYQTLINHMIATYLVVAGKTLRENYRFNSDQLREWWEKIREFSYLYVCNKNESLTDEHIIKYFNQECKLPIYFEGDEQNDTINC